MEMIDKEELLKKLGNNSWDIDEWELPHEQISAGLTANAMDRKTVEEMPTVDAVPVIRCKNCKHATPCRFYESTWYVCTRNNVGIDMNADDYCSRAERKEE